MPGKKKKSKEKIALVVKRKGHKEPFDERKIYGSIYSSCSNCELGEKECEKIADLVVEEIKKAISGRKDINSTELFGMVITILAKYHEDAAIMYEVHRDLS